MTKRTIWNRRTLVRTAAASCAAAMGVALTACSATEDAEDLLDRAQDGETIRVAYADEEPFAYQDSDGDVVGTAVNTNVHLLEQMGISEDQIEWRETEWGQLIDGLGTNHDMVIAGMYIVPERCGGGHFTNPDYQMYDTLLVPDGNPEGLEHSDDFMEREDLVVGVMDGTTELGNVEDEMELGEDQYVALDNLTALIQELKADRIDAVFLTDVNLRLAADHDDELETVGPFFPNHADGTEQIGAGATLFQEGASDFRDAMNEEIDDLLADQDTWMGLVEEFDFGEEEFPGEDLTAENLCGDEYQ